MLIRVIYKKIGHLFESVLSINVRISVEKEEQFKKETAFDKTLKYLLERLKWLAQR